MGLFGFGKKKKEEAKPVQRAQSVQSQPAPQVSYVSVPEAGTVCRIRELNTSVIVLNSSAGGKRNRRWNSYTVRDINTSELLFLLVGWNVDQENTDYSTHVWAYHDKAGWKKEDMGIGGLSRYEVSFKNVRYEAVEVTQRMCRYTGNYTCKELLGDKTYSFAGQKNVMQEMNQMKRDAFLSVFDYAGKTCYAAGYAANEKGVYRYSRSNEGDIVLFKIGHKEYVDKLDNLMLLQGDRFSPAALQEDAYYRYTEVERFDGNLSHEYHHGYHGFRMHFVSPAQGKTLYGFIRGVKGESEFWDKAYFIDCETRKEYRVKATSVGKKTFEKICSQPLACRVMGFEEKNASVADLLEFYATDARTLQYTYDDNGTAFCMDMDTFELLELPKAKLPEDIGEYDTFLYAAAEDENVGGTVPAGQFFIAEKIEAEEAEAAEEKEEVETVITLGAYDAQQDKYTLRFTTGEEISEQKVSADTLEFMEEGITEGTRLKLKMRFDDDTNQVISQVWIEK